MGTISHIALWPLGATAVSVVSVQIYQNFSFCPNSSTHRTAKSRFGRISSRRVPWRTVKSRFGRMSSRRVSHRTAKPCFGRMSARRVPWRTAKSRFGRISARSVRGELQSHDSAEYLPDHSVANCKVTFRPNVCPNSSVPNCKVTFRPNVCPNSSTHRTAKSRFRQMSALWEKHVFRHCNRHRDSQRYFFQIVK